MSKLKKIILSKFASREGIGDVRLKTARIFFVFAVLLFSVNYFFVGGGFYDMALGKTLPYTYAIFVLALVVLLHLLIVNKYLIKKHVALSFGLFFVLLAIAAATFIPLFLK